MRKSIVIAGFSGIGKTECAKKYKNVIDLDSAEYVYDDRDIQDIPFEERKGQKRKPNPNWPQNYIKAIKKAMNQYDFVLVWDREDIIKEYIKHKIAFLLCYPSIEDLHKYYAERFKNRGNLDNYIQMKFNQYPNKMIFLKPLMLQKLFYVTTKL